ncbi:MAG: hypothetical protein ACP5QG_00435 [candidate division WOR-3 bacterium]
MIRGAFHLHSSLSSDGHGDFRDWALWAKGQGLSFLIFTEHEPDVDPAELACMPDEIAGVKLLWFTEKEDKFLHWVELPGLSVLLHPGEPKGPAKLFACAEAWNLKRDGPYPSRRVLRMFAGQDILFIGGCDIHAPGYTPIVLEVEDGPDDILVSLREGRFVSRRGRVALYPDGRVEGAGIGWGLWEGLMAGYRGLRWIARKLGLAKALRWLRRRLRR